MLDEGGLKRVKVSAFAETFDCGYLASLRLDGKG